MERFFLIKFTILKKKRIFNALKKSEPEAVIKFKEVLNKIINEKN